MSTLDEARARLRQVAVDYCFAADECADPAELNPELLEQAARDFAAAEGTIRNTALEEAAKVAEAMAPVAPPGVNDTRIMHGAGMAHNIAEKIRKLKAEPK